MVQDVITLGAKYDWSSGNPQCAFRSVVDFNPISGHYRQPLSPAAITLESISPKMRAESSNF
jgi:hypothetical protein